MHRLTAGVLSAALTILVFVLGACASAPAAPQAKYTHVAEASLKPGSEIPTPTGDIILTVTGNVGAKNDGDAVVMDLATIESVGLVDYKVHDPFEDKDVTFRGVLMSDLIALWKVADTAKTYHMIALNDYVVDIPASDFKSYPVIFALQQDGEYMPVSTRGPAMLVYPYGEFELDHAIYNDRWIWQIKSIDVE